MGSLHLYTLVYAVLSIFWSSGGIGGVDVGMGCGLWVMWLDASAVWSAGARDVWGYRRIGS